MTLLSEQILVDKLTDLTTETRQTDLVTRASEPHRTSMKEPQMTRPPQSPCDEHVGPTRP